MGWKRLAHRRKRGRFCFAGGDEEGENSALGSTIVEADGCGDQSKEGSAPASGGPRTAPARTVVRARITVRGAMVGARSGLVGGASQGNNRNSFPVGEFSSLASPIKKITGSDGVGLSAVGEEVGLMAAREGVVPGGVAAGSEMGAAGGCCQRPQLNSVVGGWRSLATGVVTWRVPPQHLGFSDGRFQCWRRGSTSQLRKRCGGRGFNPGDEDFEFSDSGGSDCWRRWCRAVVNRRRRSGGSQFGFHAARGDGP